MEQFGSLQGGDEYSRAFASVRAAKNWFWCLILVALLIQCVAFVLVRFTDVIDLDKLSERAKPAAEEPAKPAEPAEPAEKKPATAPAVAAEPADDDNTWGIVLKWALPASKFLALGAATLLALTLLFAANISLVGRAPGVAGYVSAFFWSLLLWLFLVPWQQALPESAILCGATYNFGELTSQTRLISGGSAAWDKQLFYYSRFVAYPAFVLLLWLIVQVKFRQGYRRMTLGVEGQAAPPSAPTEEKI